MRWTVLLVLAGCGRLGFDPRASNTNADAAGDVTSLGDAPADCAAWLPKRFDPCAAPPSAPPQLFPAQSPYRYDTTIEGGELTDNTGTVVFSSPIKLSQADSTTVAIASWDSLVVPANVEIQVVGPRPLLIVSWSTIEVAGVLDAASLLGEVDAAAHVDDNVRIGAGANRACGVGAGSAGIDASSTGGSGGGGGGSFAGRGGSGGSGDAGAQAGGVGGTPEGSSPRVIRGGCRGGASGAAGVGATVPANAMTISAGGAGGGAIHLAARVLIDIDGRVHAGGAGGGGASNGSSDGGGGGGSGGYVGLDAPTVRIKGIVAANGGGGGGCAPYAGNGNQGANALIGTARAPGGTPFGGTCGLAGAAGAADVILDGNTATGSDSCGGGGGGGGAGFILAWGALSATGATISPPIVADPP